MHRQRRKVIAMPEPTGWPRSVAWAGSSRERASATESRMTNSTRHAHPESRSAAAGMTPSTVPANEIATIATATRASRTAGTGRACTAAPDPARASSGYTASASSRPCSANDQKAKRHNPAEANAPPINGPDSADAIHTTDRMAMIRGTSRLGKKRSWPI